MSQLQYEWKVDFALIVAIVSAFVAVAAAIWGHAQRKKERKLQVYESVYEDACFLLEFPYHLQMKRRRENEFHHEDPLFEACVRKHLNAHWMELMWGGAWPVPKELSTWEEKHAYLDRVRDAANAYRDLQQDEFPFPSVPENSPVYHIKEAEVSDRLNRVLRHVGSNLSLFSKEIRRFWENAKFLDPLEVKRSYEKCLGVCRNFFDHNSRDFDDPFYDMLLLLRTDYRNMTKSHRDRAGEWCYNLKLRVRYPRRKPRHWKADRIS